MRRRAAKASAHAVKGIAAAIRARPHVLAAVTAGVVALNLGLPLVVLSLFRKPWDYFTFNPWLAKLPAYLFSRDVSLARKLEFLPNLALFWFSADSPYGGLEWGFAVDVRGLARIVFTALVFGTYAALWCERRARSGPGGWSARASRRGGVAGALASVLGLSTGPCSVMGCGAPVLPVVALAFTGLASGTLKWLAQLSRLATAAVLAAMALGVLYLGWRAGPASSAGPACRSGGAPSTLPRAMP
jgi:hypothetical protein